MGLTKEKAGCLGRNRMAYCVQAFLLAVPAAGRILDSTVESVPEPLVTGRLWMVVRCPKARIMGPLILIILTLWEGSMGLKTMWRGAALLAMALSVALG